MLGADMANPRLVDPQPLATPTAAAAGGPDLPDELVLEAVQRLRTACLVLGALWVMGLTMNHLVAPLLGLPADQVVPWSLAADLLAGGCLVLSALVYRLAPRAARDPDRLFNIGLGYMLAIALAVGVINQWQPLALAGRLSWLCVLILIFPSIVPGPPRKILLGGVLAASMDPVGLLIARARGLELPSLGLLIWTYLPNYICALLAVVPAQIITRLGRKVSRARQLGSYRLVERIGGGGMGEVWKAEHYLLARPAAIKLIAQGFLEDAGRIAETRFRREAEAAACLRSPHTIQLYDFGITRDRRFYYVMELLEGIDLESLVERYGAQPSARVAHILQQACRSLAEAHACGMVHRDIKPGNLHLGRVGLERDFVKVLDFGLVKSDSRWLRDDVRLTAPESMSGTPAYMAPEMISGEAVDGRADLYALGCVGYYLVTGTLVFSGENALQVVLKHLQQEPEPPSQRLGTAIPDDLEQVILRCLAKSPTERPADARTLARALAPSAAGWTERDAQIWWDTTFAPASGYRDLVPTTPSLLEVAAPSGAT